MGTYGWECFIVNKKAAETAQYSNILLQGSFGNIAVGGEETGPVHRPSSSKLVHTYQ